MILDRIGSMQAITRESTQEMRAETREAL